ncbi:hypothetical protein TRFO_26200 [Tritrichomonas foetus]|uniref:Uncharacterized protein n=1 Tax=Tritrichomonas foetus TaxID=1144522 RepID=A0A1J4K905_9EUKA|nr:hypothetical protein TRFO_26200 [Tritrichomonas foetus]|eukprot:OHT05917.1 hypothetical protein TRFO_26200 [Tritrichomonas foetus]
MNTKQDLSDINPNGRYYANPVEQQILIQGLQRYFSLPERSQNRNKIAKEVSTFLRCFSPHWSHRAVRLWFNNNKHTYLGVDSENIIAQVPPGAPPPQIVPQGLNPMIQMQQFTNNRLIQPQQAPQLLPPQIISSPQIPQQIIAQNQPTSNQPTQIQQTQIQPPISPKLIQPPINVNSSTNSMPSKQKQKKQPTPPNSSNTPTQPPQPQISTQNSHQNTGQIPTQISNLPSSVPPQIQQFSIIGQPIVSSPGNSSGIAKSPIFPQIHSQISQIHVASPLSINQLTSQSPSSFQTTTQIKSVNVSSMEVNSPIFPSTPPQKSPSVEFPVDISTAGLLNNTSSLKSNNLVNNNINNGSTVNILPPITQTIPTPQISTNNSLKSSNSLNSNSNNSSNTSNAISPLQVRSPLQIASPIQITSPGQSVVEISSAIGPNISSNLGSRATLTLPPFNLSSANKSPISPSSIGSIGSLSSINGSNMPGSRFVMKPIQVAPKVRFPPLHIEGECYLPMNSEPSVDTSYGQLADLLTKIRRTDEKSALLDQEIAEFDSRCNSLKSKFYNIETERIDPHGCTTRFPFAREPSIAEFHLGDQIPESISNLDILADMPMRSPSFTHQFYATDSHTDQFTPSNIWQVRNCNDQKISFFESTAVSPEIAAYVYVQFHDKSLRNISFCNYTRRNEQWNNVVFECNTRIEAMTIGSNYAWMLADGRVTRVSMTTNTNSNLNSSLNSTLNNTLNNTVNGSSDSMSVEIPPQSGAISAYKDGSAVVAYNLSPTLCLIRNDLSLASVKTSYKGISCLSALEEKLVCGVPLSGALRMIDENGEEIRAFVGHCAPVLGMTALNASTFASRADDSTVRIWDIRKRHPVLTVTTAKNSIINIAGTADFVVAAFHNKVGVIDLRAGVLKPILGVTTDDYDAVSLNYNQREDSLAMFGIVEKEANKDSMLFMGNDGQSRQRIFRTYHDFVGRQSE